MNNKLFTKDQYNEAYNTCFETLMPNFKKDVDRMQYITKDAGNVEIVYVFMLAYLVGKYAKNILWTPATTAGALTELENHLQDVCSTVLVSLEGNRHELH